MIQKIIIFLFLIVGISMRLSAQIGIGIEAPDLLFHIDAKSNTDLSNPTDADIADDIVFTDGKLGLGTLKPNCTLDLESSFRYSDGNEDTDYILFIDDQNSVNWKKEYTKYPQLIEVSSATMDAAFKAFKFTNNSSNTYKYSGVNITLSKGVWLVYFKTVFRTWWNGGTNGNPRALFCSSSTGNGISSSEGGITGYASTNGSQAYFSGYVFLTVSQTSKNYYLWLGYISSKTPITGPTYETALAAGIHSLYAVRYGNI